MKERIFIDSSFFFVLLDKRNQAHQQAKEFFQELSPSSLTSNYVFAETVSLVTKRLGKETGILFSKSLGASRHIDLVYAGSKQEKKALDLYEKYRDKDFDYIDAISFILCQEFSIKRVLTFDHHFAQMGFICLPAGL